MRTKRSIFFILSIFIMLTIVLAAVGSALAGNGHDPITLCHNPGPHQVTITVDNESVAQAHLRHGDYLGECLPWNEATPTAVFTEEPTATATATLEPTATEAIAPTPTNTLVPPTWPPEATNTPMITDTPIVTDEPPAQTETALPPILKRHAKQFAKITRLSSYDYTISDNGYITVYGLATPWRYIRACKDGGMDCIKLAAPDDWVAINLQESRGTWFIGRQLEPGVYHLYAHGQIVKNSGNTGSIVLTVH